MSASSALGDRVPLRELTNNKNNLGKNSSSRVASELQKAKSKNSIVSKLIGFRQETQEKFLASLMIR